jgi:psp operon transcriptional activator
VAATNVDLPSLARSGKFRADLLDRLAFAVVTVPPLRVRPEDILLLAQHFGLSMAQALKRPFFPGFTKSAENSLLAYPWPGNVRELKNVIERAVAGTGVEDPSKPIDTISFDPFSSPWRPLPETAEPGSDPVDTYDFMIHVAGIEKRLLVAALERHNHHQKRTAAFLSLEYHQLRNLMRKYELFEA